MISHEDRDQELTGEVFAVPKENPAHLYLEIGFHLNADETLTVYAWRFEGPRVESSK